MTAYDTHSHRKKVAEAHTPTESGGQGSALGVAVKALSVVWKLVHIDGASMPADFMTKKLERKKIDVSVAYATNVHNVVPQ